MTDEPKITRRKITDYRPDPKNANLGSERGTYMLEQSVSEVGATRSLVASADNVIPIGNHAMQALADAGIVDVIEIETDGRQVVVVKRKDWENYDDPDVRKAAYFDNRTSEVSLQWSAEQIVTDMQSGVDLTSMFRTEEITAIVEAGLEDARAILEAQDVIDQGVTKDVARLQEAPRFPLAIVLSKSDSVRWEAVKGKLKVTQDGTALLRVLEMVEGLI